MSKFVLNFRNVIIYLMQTANYSISKKEFTSFLEEDDEDMDGVVTQCTLGIYIIALI